MAQGPRNRDCNIGKLIRKCGSRTLLEIGVCRCRGALHMIKAAQTSCRRDNIFYYGFDVFEDGTSKELKRIEHSAQCISLDVAILLLKQTGANINLYNGRTEDTLPVFVTDTPKGHIDFVWLDGGHSYETVANDWQYVSKLMGPKTIVLFDDYASNWQGEWGPIKVIDEIDLLKYTVEHLQPYDEYRSGNNVGTFCVVKVTLK